MFHLPFPFFTSLVASPGRPRSLWAAGLLWAAMLMSALPPAYAQLATEGRQFPKNVAFAEMVVVAPPDIRINGQPARLSPGARIYGTNNLLVLSGTLINQPQGVAYLKDAYGLVHQVWILSADDYKRLSRT